MLRIDSSAQHIFASSTFRVKTPDGTMFVNIMEDEKHKPIAIDLHIGKVGGSLGAWAHTFGRMLTMALEHGATLEEIAMELSSQTSDKLQLYSNGIKIRSGPEGVCHAISMYKQQKFEEATKELNLIEPRNIGKINNPNRVSYG